MDTNILFYGVATYKNYNSGNIEYKITNASDDANLAAYFLDQFIQSLPKTKEIIDFEIESDYLAEEYKQLFKNKSRKDNALILKNLIPFEYWTDFDTDLKETLFIATVIEYFAVYSEEKTNKNTILNAYKNFCKINNFKRDSLIFIKLFFKDENMRTIQSFKKSKNFLKYKESINDIIELENQEINEDEISEENIDLELLLTKPDLFSDEILLQKGEFLIRDVFANQWNKQINLLKNIYKAFKGYDMHITIINNTTGSMATFDLENSAQMLLFVGFYLKKIEMINMLDNADFVLIVRKFDMSKKNEKGIPFKNLAACFLSSNGILSIPKKEAEKAFLTDNKTGLSLKETDYIQYVGFHTMMKLLDVKIDVY